jgi:hypothetical protein
MRAHHRYGPKIKVLWLILNFSEKLAIYVIIEATNSPAMKKQTHIPSSSYLASLFPNSLSPEHLASFLWIPQT